MNILIYKQKLNLKAEGKLLADITKLSIRKIEIWKVKLDKKL